MRYMIDFTIKLFLYPVLFLLLLPRLGHASVFQALLVAFTLSDVVFAADLMLLQHLDRSVRWAGSALLLAVSLYLFQFFLPGMHLSPWGASLAALLTTAADAGLRSALIRPRPATPEGD